VESYYLARVTLGPPNLNYAHMRKGIIVEPVKLGCAPSNNDRKWRTGPSRQLSARTGWDDLRSHKPVSSSSTDIRSIGPWRAYLRSSGCAQDAKGANSQEGNLLSAQFDAKDNGTYRVWHLRQHLHQKWRVPDGRIVGQAPQTPKTGGGNFLWTRLEQLSASSKPRTKRAYEIEMSGCQISAEIQRNYNVV
jgi:hypothetical protein